MAPTTRSAKKTKSTEEKASAKQQKQQQKQKGSGDADQEEDDDPPLPFASRMVIIIFTSYIAEKIWRYRSVVSAGWYSDRQSSVEQAMITAFEYTILMGLLFFTGILVSVVTVSIQKKITG